MPFGAGANGPKGKGQDRLVALVLLTCCSCTQFQSYHGTCNQGFIVTHASAVGNGRRGMGGAAAVCGLLPYAAGAQYISTHLQGWRWQLCTSLKLRPTVCALHWTCLATAPTKYFHWTFSKPAQLWRES
jgi:hypothetical protein